MKSQPRFFTKKEKVNEQKELSTHKRRVLETRAEAKRLINQYKSIVKEQQKTIDNLMQNLPKMIYVLLLQKFPKLSKILRG